MRRDFTDELRRGSLQECSGSRANTLPSRTLQDSLICSCWSSSCFVMALAGLPSWLASFVSIRRPAVLLVATLRYK
jgi:hypothetical protein